MKDIFCFSFAFSRTHAKLNEAACIVVFLFVCLSVCLYVRAKTEKNQLIRN